MKGQQYVESLRELNGQALQAAQRANTLAEQHISTRVLAKAIGLLLVVDVMVVGVATSNNPNAYADEGIVSNECIRPRLCAPTEKVSETNSGSVSIPSKRSTVLPLKKQPAPSVTGKPKASPAPVATASLLKQAELSLLGLKRGTIGVDVSHPNCATPIRPDAKFGIVGVNRGRPFTSNQCLGAEAAKFKNPGLYVNTSLNLQKAKVENNPNIKCPLSSNLCASYRWGYRAGKFAVNTAQASGVNSLEWYMDVETANKWSDSVEQNRASIKGTMDAVRTSAAKNNKVSPEKIYEAVYSNKRMWGIITGGWKLPNVEVWYATGGLTESKALEFCDKPSSNFTGGGVVMIQTGNQDKTFPHAQDINLVC